MVQSHSHKQKPHTHTHINIFSMFLFCLLFLFFFWKYIFFYVRTKKDPARVIYLTPLKGLYLILWMPKVSIFNCVIENVLISNPTFNVGNAEPIKSNGNATVPSNSGTLSFGYLPIVHRTTFVIWSGYTLPTFAKFYHFCFFFHFFTFFFIFFAKHACKQTYPTNTRMHSCNKQKYTLLWPHSSNMHTHHQNINEKNDFMHGFLCVHLHATKHKDTHQTHAHAYTHTQTHKIHTKIYEYIKNLTMKMNVFHQGMVFQHTFCRQVFQDIHHF